MDLQVEVGLEVMYIMLMRHEHLELLVLVLEGMDGLRGLIEGMSVLAGG